MTATETLRDTMGSTAALAHLELTVFRKRPHERRGSEAPEPELVIRPAGYGLLNGAACAALDNAPAVVILTDATGAILGLRAAGAGERDAWSLGRTSRASSTRRLSLRSWAHAFGVELQEARYPGHLVGDVLVFELGTVSSAR